MVLSLPVSLVRTQFHDEAGLLEMLELIGADLEEYVIAWEFPKSAMKWNEIQTEFG
jgi:hypothetical protein